MVWEFATAVAGRLLGINPFDQPDVEAPRSPPAACWTRSPSRTPASFVDGAIEVRGGDWLARRSHGRGSRRRPARQARPDDSYLSVQAYFDRLAFAALEGVRRRARRRQRPAGHVRLGAAVPALHRPVPQGRTRDRRVPPGHRGSRGGPGHPGPSVHLRGTDLRPGRRRCPGPGRARPPVLRLHLTDRAAGVAQLQEIVAALPPGSPSPKAKAPTQPCQKPNAAGIRGRGAIRSGIRVTAV